MDIMVAITDQKARLLDLTTGILELTRDNKRDIEEVSAVLQIIKDDPHFAMKLLAEKSGRPAWEVWRTLTIGGVPTRELLERLEGDGHAVSDWARDIMGKPQFTMLPEPAEIQLARAKVRDLGFIERPTTTKLLTRIKEVGELCPAEVGPHLRLADQDQPKGTGYWIAMEPITGSDGYPSVFRVLRYDNGGRLLNADYASPGVLWRFEDGIVFCFREPAKILLHKT